MSQVDLSRIRGSIYETLSEVSSALASPARLKIIQLLSQAPRGVEEVSKQTGESMANTSQHLQRLAKAGLVRFERRGVSRVYRVASPAVSLLWEQLQDVAHELHGELNRHEDLLTDPELRAPVSAEEALRQVARGEAVLLDAREAYESESSPVAGAQQIEKPRLRKGKAVYVFCRGRYCGLASEAVRKLRRLGYKAYRLRESPARLRVIQGGGE